MAICLRAEAGCIGTENHPARVALNALTTFCNACTDVQAAAFEKAQQLLQAQNIELGQETAQLHGDAQAQVTPAEMNCGWLL